MYSAKKVLPVPLSPYRMTGVAAGANACARDTASTVTGARAMGACDDGWERRSETRRGVVTRLETFACRRKNHYGPPTCASGGSAANVIIVVEGQQQNLYGGVKAARFLSSSIARNQPRRALIEEVVPRPVDQHEQLVAEADQLDDVNAEPHHPCYESAGLHPEDVRDRGIAADRGQRPLVAVAERLERLPAEPAYDVARDGSSH